MSTSHPTSKPEKTNRDNAAGLSTGFSLGAGLGVALWLTTGQFIFFPVFVGAGLTIGAALDTKKKQEEETDEDDV